MSVHPTAIEVRLVESEPGWWTAIYADGKPVCRPTQNRDAAEWVVCLLNGAEYRDTRRWPCLPSRRPFA